VSQTGEPIPSLADKRAYDVDVKEVADRTHVLRPRPSLIAKSFWFFRRAPLTYSRYHGLVQKNVAGLDYLLQFARRHARQGDAIAVAEINHRIAMHVAGNERLQLLHRLCACKVIKLDGVLLRIEINNTVGAHTSRKDEIVTAGTAD
jgi:hypothetical protein